MEKSGATSRESYDVAIVGGGPTGTTAASLLMKYNPSLRVVILEKAKFPRDHVGESQLPSCSTVLDEMGAWEKVEAAGFPIKIGASYTWGRNAEKWDFDFYPIEEWLDESRPARFEGQRRFTAFQVDRAVYDEILIRHAAMLGAEVREETRVVEIKVDGDRVDGLTLESGETIRARYYIDGSGTVGLIRRALNIDVEITQELQNIAVWDYWQNAEWSVEIGVGATRVQVRSLPYGWIWFIPLGPTRTSIGLICPAEYYRRAGLEPEALYVRALSEQPDIAALVQNAEREKKLQSCKDWSQLSARIVGENWFLAGESAGFADPILAAGMSLAHSSAREAAYTILELDRGKLDPAWLRERYNDRNRTNVSQHIRFAQFWYAANGCFTDLQEHCQRIAAEAGAKLSPQQAWRWLSQGGFITDQTGLPAFGSFDVASARQIINLFDAKDSRKTGYNIDGYNVFKLNLKGATKGKIGVLEDGRINLIECYERAHRKLPIAGYYRLMIEALQCSPYVNDVWEYLTNYLGGSKVSATLELSRCFQALDVMIDEYWVTRSRDKKRPMLHADNEGSRYIRSHTETRRTLDEKGAKCTINWNAT